MTPASEPSPRSPDGATSAADETPETPTTSTVRAAGSPLLPWAVALAALLVAGFSTWQWLSLAGAEQTREEVRRTAESFVAALTNWDASDGLGGTREALEELGTGEFAEEVDELFGGDLGEQLVAAEAVSTGEVQDVFVQRIEGEQATAFGVVVQQLRTRLSDRPERTVRSARLHLVRVDDRWLISGVELLADGVAPAPEAPPTEEESP